MKKIFIISMLLVSLIPLFSQDLKYTVTGIFNYTKVSLDSILFENITNGTQLKFENLPKQPDYIINLSTCENEGSTGIVDFKFENGFKIIQNIFGKLSIAYVNAPSINVNISVYNVQGQMLYISGFILIKSGNIINVELGKEGIYIVKIESSIGVQTFKALGYHNYGLIESTIEEQNISKTEKIKSSLIYSETDFSFKIGDSLRISVYKDGYYARPKVLKISTSLALPFTFQTSTVSTYGVSDAFVNIEETGTTNFNLSSGDVQITNIVDTNKIYPGDIIVIDADTTGYLRKVLSVTEFNGEITLQTEQAYLDELFVDVYLKLNTEFREPEGTLKNTSSSEEIITALTDEDRYIHPVEIIYFDEAGNSRKKSIFDNTDAKDFTSPILDFYRDLSGTDLYGQKGEGIFFIDEGHVSLTSDAVFEFDFKYKGELDENTKIKKGDLKTFKFYLDSEADFLAKLILNMSKSYEEENTKKKLDLSKVRAKFIVPPGIPVWISLDPDIYIYYYISADTNLQADWGFESNHTLQVGGLYDKETDSFTAIKEYTPVNNIYPLNIDGEVNVFTRLELYPRLEVKFYDFPGPYAEIVPYLEGNYNAALQSQITPTGSETFLAWDSELDLGLDFRVGTKLSFLKFNSKEFGPTTVHCFEFPFWYTPANLELLTTHPGEVEAGSTYELAFRVTDNSGMPEILCPIYISGDGEFSKYILITNSQGEATVDWTVGIVPGNYSFIAEIFMADKSIITQIKKTVKVPYLKIKEIIENVNIDTLVSNVRVLSGEDYVRIDSQNQFIVNRVSGTPTNRMAAKFIEQKLKSFGLKTYEQYFTGYSWMGFGDLVSGYNIYAIQEGEDTTAKYIICAHYDAATDYCADDNASGTAIVLEAARIISQHKPPYTIIYAFWDQEEAWLVGSSAFASYADSIHMNIQGVLNIDMVGWDGNNDGLAEIHTNHYGHSAELAGIINNLNFDYSIGLNTIIIDPGQASSDNVSFAAPGVLFIESYLNDFNPYYHTVDDRIFQFNLGYFERMAKLAVAGIATMASILITADEEIEIDEAAAKASSFDHYWLINQQY